METANPIPTEAAESELPEEIDDAPENSMLKPDDFFKEETKRIADIYGDLLSEFPEDITGGIYLTDQQMQSILGKLGGEGLVAFDYTRQSPLTNTQKVFDFFSDYNAGINSDLTLIEVTQDGGFLLRNIENSHEGKFLTLVRLSWLEGQAEITFADLYEITELYLSSANCIVYDYFFPNNPQGGNHDGHVETLVSIELYP